MATQKVARQQEDPGETNEDVPTSRISNENDRLQGMMVERLCFSESSATFGHLYGITRKVA
ncbi:hypothetical protein OAN94_03720 [Verrucomicrobiales bacterium]|nr:hypothetical protein [Verrucomicrobiales bacterium]MDC0312761.1 hypothetical protein [Verrucomicrobiales bacterium]MDC0503363.1 hypothetical protein [Verrucomicrobiales bacterium]